MTAALRGPMPTIVRMTPDTLPRERARVDPPAGDGHAIEPGRPADARPDRPGPGWSRSLLLSLLLHGAVAGAFMIRWSDPPKVDEAPPAAMVVDLTTLSSSAPSEPQDVAPGPEQVESQPAPTPVPEAKFEPPPQADPALQPAFALPPKAESRPVEAPAAAKETTQTTAPPPAPVAEAKASKAPVEGNTSAAPSTAEQGWESRLLAKLERSKRYPAAARAAGQQDTVLLRLVIDRKGRLVDAAIRRSAGLALLDGETLALAKRASPYPAPPDSVPGDTIVRIVPVEFYTRPRR